MSDMIWLWSVTLFKLLLLWTHKIIENSIMVYMLNLITVMAVFFVLFRLIACWQDAEDVF